MIVLMSGCVPTTPKEEVSASSKANNPWYVRGACRAVYIQTPDKEAALAELKRVTKLRGWYGATLGVYQTKSGDYIGAWTMSDYYRNPASYRKNHDPISAERSILSDAKSGYYHPTARCSDGSEIVAETGLWHTTEQADGKGGLVGLAVMGVGHMLEGAGEASSSGSPSSTASYQACTSDAPCFTVTGQDGPQTTIQCTKGPSTGNSYCVRQDSEGYWRPNCGSMFGSGSYYKKLQEVANSFCDR